MRAGSLLSTATSLQISSPPPPAFSSSQSTQTTQLWTRPRPSPVSQSPVARRDNTSEAPPPDGSSVLLSSHHPKTSLPSTCTCSIHNHHRHRQPLTLIVTSRTKLLCRRSGSGLIRNVHFGIPFPSTVSLSPVAIRHSHRAATAAPVAVELSTRPIEPAQPPDCVHFARQRRRRDAFNTTELTRLPQFVSF